jgi:hypothetical protein
MNDKIIGMFCVTIMFLAVVIAWAIVGKPLDTGIKELGGMIVTGIMGTMVGVKIGKSLK